MSKQDILNVSTLTAHLMARVEHSSERFIRTAASVAQDAMALQKLGRRANKLAERACSDSSYSEEKQAAEEARIASKVDNILRPYGLTAKISSDPRGYCLKIQGLPGNTWGGDEEGFGI